MAYNKNRCQGCLRGSFTDKWGRQITIGGIHSYEYFIEVKTITTVTVIPILMGLQPAKSSIK